MEREINNRERRASAKGKRSNPTGLREAHWATARRAKAASENFFAKSFAVLRAFALFAVTSPQFEEDRHMGVYTVVPYLVEWVYVGDLVAAAAS